MVYFVSAFSLGSKAGDLQESSAGEDSQLFLVVTRFHILDEVGRQAVDYFKQVC